MRVTFSSNSGNNIKAQGFENKMHVTTSNHAMLTNRDKENQHPIKAISGLTEELNSKLDEESMQPITNLSLERLLT